MIGLIIGIILVIFVLRLAFRLFFGIVSFLFWPIILVVAGLFLLKFALIAGVAFIALAGGTALFHQFAN